MAKGNYAQPSELMMGAEIVVNSSESLNIVQGLINRIQNSDDRGSLLGSFEVLKENLGKLQEGIREAAVHASAEVIPIPPPTKMERLLTGRLRFAGDGYHSLIGCGEDAASEVYQQFSNKYPPLAGHKVGFLRRTQQMKNTAKNGFFELVLEPGDPNNALEKRFKATLHQYPDNGAKAPKIVYPPALGDKSNCVQTDDLWEVSSMSTMMRHSLLQGAQTPAVMFNLVEHLKHPKPSSGIR